MPISSNRIAATTTTSRASSTPQSPTTAAMTKVLATITWVRTGVQANVVTMLRVANSLVIASIAMPARMNWTK